MGKTRASFLIGILFIVVLALPGISFSVSVLDGFNPMADDILYSITVQPDGKISLTGGWFTSIGGQARNYIARLNPDGSADTAFNPGANGDYVPFVKPLVVRGDGKIIAAGGFTSIGGQARNSIARLDPDGTADQTFNPDSNNWIYTLALQGDGKILAGGYFTRIGGQTRNYIARLNPDGTADPAFNPNANGFVFFIAPQPDGKILLGGTFTSIGGQARNNIARLNPDGTVDLTLIPTQTAR